MREGERDRGERRRTGRKQRRRDATVLLVLVAGSGALADLAVGESGGARIRAMAAGEEDGDTRINRLPENTFHFLALIGSVHYQKECKKVDV